MNTDEDSLRQLSRLHADGVLTDVEFADARSRMLSSTSAEAHAFPPPTSSSQQTPAPIQGPHGDACDFTLTVRTAGHDPSRVVEVLCERVKFEGVPLERDVGEALVAAAPCTLAEGLSREAAESLRSALAEVGAEVLIERPAGAFIETASDATVSRDFRGELVGDYVLAVLVPIVGAAIAIYVHVAESRRPIKRHAIGILGAAALSVVAYLAIFGVFSSGASGSCLVTSQGNTVCGQAAVAWCNATAALRDDALSGGLLPTNEANVLQQTKSDCQALGANP